MEEARILTSGREIKARGDGAQAWREACHYTLLSRSSALITWRPQARERRLSLWVDIVVKEAAVSTRGRLLHATTDWRLLCRPISSIPAVRQLSAGKSVGRSDSSPGSPRGGGRWKTSRATVARGERASCAEKRTGEATYARGRKCENALELQGGRAPAESPGQAIARESTLDKRRRRYGRAGVHTENAWKQTRRQRLGVARRSADTHGNARCIPVFWVWGSR